MKPTATPWIVSGQSDGGKYISITDANGRQACRVPFGEHDLDTATSIVRSRNAHDELVAALQRIAHKPGTYTALEYQRIAHAALAKVQKGVYLETKE